MNEIVRLSTYLENTSNYLSKARQTYLETTFDHPSDACQKYSEATPGELLEALSQTFLET